MYMYIQYIINIIYIILCARFSMCVGFYIKNMVLFANLLKNTLVCLTHPQSVERQGQETLLAPSADKQTCNYFMECSHHHSFLISKRFIAIKVLLVY